jgi:hypothetical protein
MYSENKFSVQNIFQKKIFWALDGTASVLGRIASYSI